MSVYERGTVPSTTLPTLTLKESHIYASKRLGFARRSEDMMLGYAPPDFFRRTLGQKAYEHCNHLGNVLVVTSDKKIPVPIVSTTSLDYYIADVRSSQDYFAFGNIMPGRTSVTAGEDYRYGANGMEKVDEIHNGAGTAYMADFRMNDPRLGGRWWSCDPVVKPWESPYAGYANNPVVFVDPSGLDPGEGKEGGDGGVQRSPTPKNDSKSTYNNPLNQPVAIPKGSEVFGDKDGHLISFRPPSETFKYFWDAEKNAYYKSDFSYSEETGLVETKIEYSEGSWLDGFNYYIHTDNSTEDFGIGYEIQSFADDPLKWLNSASGTVMNGLTYYLNGNNWVSMYNGCVWYCGLSAYQKGIADAVGVVNFGKQLILSAPLVMLGYTVPICFSATTMLLTSMTTEEGFFLGSFEVRAPFNIPVQRFGTITSGKQCWGLQVGSNTLMNRTFYAILPEWNSLTTYTTGYIYKGAKLRIGLTGYQGGLYIGGFPQIIVNGYKVLGKQTIIK
jgi:hypothetical protein